jgi:selenium metabolism protein YedF
LVGDQVDGEGEMRIDARGLRCPKPVMLAEEAVSGIGEGMVEVLVDNEASVKNLSRFAKSNALYSETEKVDDYWKVKLVKGYPCELPEAGPQAGEEKPEKRENILLVITSHVIGRDEALGRVLMKGFFETMKVTRELPDMLFFMNTAVRLTTSDEEFVSLLKEIEAMGVEIFTCGTCLDHHGLAPALKVGYRGTTNHIVEGMKDFSKVVWL